MKKEYISPRCVIAPLVVKTILAGSLNVDDSIHHGIHGDAKRLGFDWDEEDFDE